MKRQIIYPLFLLFITLFAGCKSKQAISQQNISRTIKRDVKQEVINNCIASEPKFKTMNISKMSMTIGFGARNFTFRGQIRMTTDSLISVSILPILGIELFRIDCTPEGFTIYDKMNRRYAEGGYDYIQYKTGVNANFHTIQAICSNRLFSLSSAGDSFHNDFTIEPGDNASIYTLIGIEEILGAHQQFDIDSESNRIIMAGARKNDELIHEIRYADLRKINGISFPTSIIAKSAFDNIGISMSLDVEKVDFNRAATSPSINLARYTKTTISKIISL